MLYNKSSNEISREIAERNDRYDYETNLGGEWDDDGSLDFCIGIEKSEMASQIIVRAITEGKLVEVIETMDDFRSMIHRHDPDGKIGAFSMNHTMSYPQNATDDSEVIALANRMKAAFVIYHDNKGSHWAEDLKPTPKKKAPKKNQDPCGLPGMRKEIPDHFNVAQLPEMRWVRYRCSVNQNPNTEE